MDTDKNYDGYVECVYQHVRKLATGYSYIFEDAVINLVGITGMSVLIANKFLEYVGVMNGRPLYVLCCEGES